MEKGTKKIFVGSSTESRSLAEEVIEYLEDLEQDYNIEIVPWWKNSVFVPGRTTIDEILRAIKECDGGIFVFSENDCVSSKKNKSDVKDLLNKNETYITSSNVLIESGMFYGMKGQNAVCLFADKIIPTPSDYNGITRINYDKNRPQNTKSKLSEWIKQLKKHTGAIVLSYDHGLHNINPIFMTNKKTIERTLSLQQREQGAKEIRLVNFAGTSFLASKNIGDQYDDTWRIWFNEALKGGIKITIILNNPNSAAAKDAADYKMFPSHGGKINANDIISENIKNIEDLVRNNREIRIDAYLTDIALPYAVFETIFDDPNRNHIKVDLYSPLTFNDDKRPSFMVYKEENPILYSHFSDTIDFLTAHSNRLKIKI